MEVDLRSLRNIASGIVTTAKMMDLLVDMDENKLMEEDVIESVAFEVTDITVETEIFTVDLYYWPAYKDRSQTEYYARITDGDSGNHNTIASVDLDVLEEEIYKEIDLVIKVHQLRHFSETQEA